MQRSHFNTGSLNRKGSRPKWMQYGGFYRPIDDFSRSWVPSPLVRSPLPVPNAPVFQVDLKGPSSPVESFETQSSSGHLPPLRDRTSAIPRMEPSERPARRRSTIRKLAERVFRRTDPDQSSPDPRHRRERRKKLPHTLPSEGLDPLPERVRANEWKEWGYYARPFVNGVQVYNTLSPFLTPTAIHSPQFITDTNLTPEEVFDTLLDPDGTPHPERWKLGITHPSLPPRPSRWTPPDHTKPLPFPWEVQLNPFLEHILFGVPRMYWDIREDITAAQYGIEDDDGARPLSASDLSQPATWPFLTHMYINAVADDIAPRFAWPIMVSNKHGIKIHDIINSIYANFQEYVFPGEFYSWTMTRRKEASKARHLRCNPTEHPFKALYDEVDPDDRMKRIDYLVGRTLFRGLAPNPDATGWVLFLGQD